MFMVLIACRQKIKAMVILNMKVLTLVSCLPLNEELSTFVCNSCAWLCGQWTCATKVIIIMIVGMSVMITMVMMVMMVIAMDMMVMVMILCLSLCTFHVEP